MKEESQLGRGCRQKDPLTDFLQILLFCELVSAAQYYQIWLGCYRSHNTGSLYVCQSNLTKDITNRRQRYMPKTCLCYKSQFKMVGGRKYLIYKRVNIKLQLTIYQLCGGEMEVSCWAIVHLSVSSVMLFVEKESYKIKSGIICLSY